jgi:hypothetical protein
MHQGALPASARPHDGYELAATYVKFDAPQSAYPAIASIVLVRASDFDHRLLHMLQAATLANAVNRALPSLLLRSSRQGKRDRKYDLKAKSVHKCKFLIFSDYGLIFDPFLVGGFDGQTDTGVDEGEGQRSEPEPISDTGIGGLAAANGVAEHGKAGACEDDTSQSQQDVTGAWGYRAATVLGFDVFHRAVNLPSRFSNGNERLDG